MCDHLAERRTRPWACLRVYKLVRKLSRGRALNQGAQPVISGGQGNEPNPVVSNRELAIEIFREARRHPRQIATLILPVAVLIERFASQRNCPIPGVMLPGGIRLHAAHDGIPALGTE